MIFTLVAALLTAAHARVQRDVLHRSGTRAAAQWTLLDWLDDRNQISLLNSVLAYDRATDWYEINVATRVGQSVRAGHRPETERRLDVDAYLFILNAHGEYSATAETRVATGVAAGLRVLGISTRTTNVVARYGWRQQRDDEIQPKPISYRFAEVEAQLYVGRFGGLTGGYRVYDPKGSRAEASLFVEAQPLRLTVGYAREVLAEQTREVLSGGVKAFF